MLAVKTATRRTWFRGTGCSMLMTKQIKPVAGPEVDDGVPDDKHVCSLQKLGKTPGLRETTKNTGNLRYLRRFWKLCYKVFLLPTHKSPYVKLGINNSLGTGKFLSEQSEVDFYLSRAHPVLRSNTSSSGDDRSVSVGFAAHSVNRF
ncbi:hypothetical protein RRG08_042508 [Elysia crispata]|uniref:Uncharacterized protein n=1 Tax=Elysia crispata TaxID=231223 RepID=A0AAE1CKJ4_9GAST|nr:hypothetical protein RRG08_042508 [Elysia crispata]